MGFIKIPSDTVLDAPPASFRKIPSDTVLDKPSEGIPTGQRTAAQNLPETLQFAGIGDTGIKISPKTSAFLAGMGYGATDIYRGIKQIFGIGRDELKADAKLMEVLRSDPEVGKAAFGGQIVGTIVDPLGAAIPVAKGKTIAQMAKIGAGAGAAAGGLGYVEEGRTRAGNIALGAGAGAVFGPAVGGAMNIARKVRGKELIPLLAKQGKFRKIPSDTVLDKPVPADTKAVPIEQPPIKGIPEAPKPPVKREVVRPEPVPQVKLEALQEKFAKPKEMKDAVKEGVQVSKQERPRVEEVRPKPEAIGGDRVIGEAKILQGEKAVNINLDKLETTNDVKDLVKQTSQFFKGEVDATRRGKITQERTQELADSLGMTPERLVKTRKGRAFNAEEAKASRDILVKSADDSMKLAEKYMKDTSDESLAKFTAALTRHVEIQKAVSGITAEAGRALSQFRMKAKGLEKAKQLELMIDQFGGKDKAQFIADKLSKMSEMSVADRARFITDSTKATTMDKVFEAWINGLLSSPTTHLVNITSNSLVFLSKFPERAIGTTLDLMKAKATGTPRQRFYGEMPYQVVGGWQGLKEGVRKGLYAFKNEVSPEMATKLDVQRYQAISGKKGKLVRIPGRLLIAADEFFKAVNYQAELYGLSYRQAAKEGKRGATRSKRMAEILADPAEEMKEKAEKEMLYRVFQKELGSFGKGIQKLRTKSSAMKVLIPFLRTPINIAKFGLERTVLNAPLVMRRALKGDLKGAQVTDEAAKIVMGSLIGAGIYTMTNEGTITGWGPKKPAERAALYRTGWQPYSLKIGDKYYSYFRLEPLGMIFGLAADFAEIQDQMTADEIEDLPALIALAIGRNLINKTFMRSLSDALNAMSDPERYGKRWVRGFGSTVIPRGVAAVARAVDPEMRQTNSFVDYLKSQIPGLSEDLAPRRDLWGRPITRGGGTVTRLFSPSRVSEIKKDPVDSEMLRLEVYVGKPMNRIRGIKLTPSEYDAYQKLSGERARLRVERYMNSPFYKKVNDDRKAKVIKREILKAREIARRKVYMRIPIGRKK